MTTQTFPCKGVRTTGNCPCTDFVLSRYDKHYTHCECGDVAGTHGIVESKFDFERHRHLEAGEARLKPKKATVEAPTKVVYKSVSEAPAASNGLSAEYTPAQLRKALKDAGVPCGERGRLSPDQKAKAISILNGGK